MEAEGLKSEIGSQSHQQHTKIQKAPPPVISDRRSVVRKSLKQTDEVDFQAMSFATAHNFAYKKSLEIFSDERLKFMPQIFATARRLSKPMLYDCSFDTLTATPAYMEAMQFDLESYQKLTLTTDIIKLSLRSMEHIIALYDDAIEKFNSLGRNKFNADIEKIVTRRVLKFFQFQGIGPEEKAENLRKYILRTIDYAGNYGEPEDNLFAPYSDETAHDQLLRMLQDSSPERQPEGNINKLSLSLSTKRIVTV